MIMFKVGGNCVHEIKATKEPNTKYNYLVVFVINLLESAISVKKILYKEDTSILSKLKKHNTWITWSKFLTYREVSIEFIKYISPIVTLQTLSKL